MNIDIHIYTCEALYIYIHNTHPVCIIEIYGALAIGMHPWISGSVGREHL
jgi:hypothetical protein